MYYEEFYEVKRISYGVELVMGESGRGIEMSQMTAFLTFKAMEYTAQSVTDMGSLREDDFVGKPISILPNI